jgi:hypothetical protein
VTGMASLNRGFGDPRLGSSGTSTDEASPSPYHPLTLSPLAAFLRLWGACLAPALHVDRCGPKDLVTSPKMQHSICIYPILTVPVSLSPQSLADRRATSSHHLNSRAVCPTASSRRSYSWDSGARGLAVAVGGRQE